ncbi:MAG TPA: hypothetical protein VK707_01545 [Solirubrobacteraceae bacterium]|jgi:hypothetical protein|nr:hypothetical protein [Solirubrobacteraceae bacterium]
MRTSAEWGQTKLGEGLRLLLGRRDDAGGLDARPVELTTEVADVLRDAARTTLVSLGQRSPKAYSTLGDADSDEFLSLAITSTDTDDDNAAPAYLEETLSAADIVRLSLGAFAASNFLLRDELFEGGWLFYAVVVEVVGSNDPIAFVRQYNPQRGFDPGRLLGVYGDVLKQINDPVFNFDLNFDVVVAYDEVAVLRATAFQRVFADVNVAASEVPSHVKSLESGLNISITAVSSAVLTASCQDRLRMAARLKSSRNSHTSNLLRPVASGSPHEARPRP